MRIALAQINPTIGALDDTRGMVATWIERARDAGADLVVFPELVISGYPPKDLLLQEGFVEACVRTAEQIGREHSRGLTILLGCPRRTGDGLCNSLVAYRDGAELAWYDKRLLPTYDVFDEDRYFEPGHEAVVIEVAGRRVGLSLCEDLWRGEDVGFSARYLREADPVADMIAAGAELIVNPSASPFVLGKGQRHRDILRRHAVARGVPIAAVNQVGGNDELVFDGHSRVFDGSGRLVAAGPGFEEALVVCDLPFDAPEAQPTEADPRIEAPAEELMFKALRLGIADYCRKTGFGKVLLGVSGGIDSAVVAALAAAALGPEAVLGIAMPGPYSSEHSLEDARALAEALGIQMVTIPIKPPMDGAEAAIDPAFAELGQPALGSITPDVTEENLQSRLRGMIAMTVSNRTGALVLTTGNKSELAVGYCTLYGDMNGGLAVINDLTKLQVYAVARWMNEQFASCGFARPPIPQRTIDKPPSAELAPDQFDSDSLPPYEVLDEIVRRFIEQHQSRATIVRETGFDEATVRRVLRLIDISEYKRKQMATGLKISGVAFGFGRRMPIARGWHAG